jgi:ribonucleoside-diphosphate reductase alpha chain
LAVEAGVQLDLTDAAMEEEIDAQVAAAGFADSEPSPNGSNGHRAPQPVAVATAATAVDAGTASAQSALAAMMGDAPLCETCGHITIRSGSCYKCLNCGGTTGCS